MVLKVSLSRITALVGFLYQYLFYFHHHVLQAMLLFLASCLVPHASCHINNFLSVVHLFPSDRPRFLVFVTKVRERLYKLWIICLAIITSSLPSNFVDDCLWILCPICSMLPASKTLSESLVVLNPFLMFINKLYSGSMCVHISTDKYLVFCTTPVKGLRNNKNFTGHFLNKLDIRWHGLRYREILNDR